MGWDISVMRGMFMNLVGKYLKIKALCMCLLTINYRLSTIDSPQTPNPISELFCTFPINRYICAPVSKPLFTRGKECINSK